MVYRLVIADTTMYIGSTSNIYNRLANHAKQRQFDKVLVHRCYSREEARELEAYLIYREQPPWNVTRGSPRKPKKSSRARDQQKSKPGEVEL